MSKFNEPITFRDLAGIYENILCSTTEGEGKRLVHSTILTEDGKYADSFRIELHTNGTAKQPKTTQSTFDYKNALDSYNLAKP